MPTIRSQDLVSDGWWVLSGSLVKAANTRQLAPFIETLARQYFNRGDAYDEAIIGFSTSVNSIYKLLYEAEVFLTEGEHERLRQYVLDMGRSHMRCRQQASKLGELAFQVRPKAHYSQHLPSQCKLINSRYTQCYQDESMIGVVAKIYKRSCAGPYKSTIQRSVCMKYLVAWAIATEL